jgi:pilus assembly protein CpaE
MSVLERFADPQPLDMGGAECVAFICDGQTREVVANVAQQFFDEPVVRDGDTSDALAFLAEAPAPKVLIVDLGDNSSPLSAMLSLTTAFTEDTRLIGIGEVNDVSLYRELTGAGVTDYLVKPVTEKALSSALERAEESVASTAQPAATEEAKRVVVIGARGGVGASTVAVNFAWLFAEEHQLRTTLVDLDLEFGTVALSLDLEPTRGLREALENPGRIDALFISSATAKLTERFSVMATEENLSGEIAFSPDSIGVLFESLARTNECIVVDLPRPAFAVRHQTLRAATHVVLVTELSLSGLRDTIRLLGNIEEATSKAKIMVVANRGGGDQQAMRLPDFQKALGRKVDSVVPEESKAFNEAANTGKPLVHFAARSKAAKTLQKLAGDILGRKAKAAKGRAAGPKKPWLSLGKRSKS